MPLQNDYADSLYKVRVNTPSGEVECVAASYDGIPFFIEETETSGGRNIVTTSLPFSDTHINEDVGGKPRSFTFSIFLVGPNCDADRKKLEAAFEKQGYFEFSHPYYGKFNARCPEYGFKYSSGVQEYVSGTVLVVPEGVQKKSGRSVEDLRGVVVAKSDVVLNSAKSNFLENFSILGKAKSIVDTVAAYTDKALEEIENVRNSIRDVTEFVSTIAKIRDNVALILGTPADFADRIQNLLTMTKDVLSVGFANDAVKESLDIIDSLVSAKRDSADLVANDLNGDIDRLQLMSAAAMAARSVVDSSFKSAEEAREMQDKVAATFTAAADVAESVDDYADLMDLQAAALKYLRDEMSKLAVIVELPMSYSRDILSVCFDCYGNLDRVDDILERNGIGDPLVITARNVRVLSK